MNNAQRSLFVDALLKLSVGVGLIFPARGRWSILMHRLCRKLNVYRPG
jgi:hypothetical protein